MYFKPNSELIHADDELIPVRVALLNYFKSFSGLRFSCRFLKNTAVTFIPDRTKKNAFGAFLKMILIRTNSRLTQTS